MDSKGFRGTYQRGLMPLVILSLLRRQDMYGYQLVQETEQLSGGAITTQEGSLYPVLYKLEEQGLISNRKVLVGKRMTRIYYHIEDAGIRALAALTAQYRQVTAGMKLLIGELEEENGQQ